MQSRVENVIMHDYSPNMPYSEARKRHMQVVTEIRTVSDSESGWSFGVYQKTLRVQGKKVYLKSVRIADIAFRTYNRLGKIQKRWIGNPDSLAMDDLKMVLMHFKRDWAYNMLEEQRYMFFYMKKKTALNKIIDGSITSYEGLYKHLIKNVYKVKINVPSMKIYAKYSESFLIHRTNIYDVMDFTTNPDMFFQKLKESKERGLGRQYEALLFDTLLTSADLGKKLNPMWSLKRLEDEHIKQILEINGRELSEKADNPIYENVSKITTRNVKVLNSEREIFEYACRYSNCVYTNYYSRIADGNYIAVIVNVNGEEAMLGITRYNDVVNFNQCMRKRNISPSNLMYDFAKHYIQCYNKELKELKVNQDISHNTAVTTYAPLALPFDL